MKKAIKEVIVVEGKNDSANLKRYYECDTIETHGIGIDEKTISLIRDTNKTRGVIIFTDPDSPGNRIRNIINENVADCKNAYIDKTKARTEKKVGIEHADFAALEEALANTVTFCQTYQEIYTMVDMYELGLSGQKDSYAKRDKLGQILHLGNGTAKTMCKRLNHLGIDKEKLKEVLAHDN